MGGRLAAGAVKIANARGGEATRKRAADYVVTPFSWTALTARIRTALCRQQTSAPFVLGGLFIDYDQRRGTVADAQARLTETEFQLPAVLSINADRVSTLRHPAAPGLEGARLRHSCAGASTHRETWTQARRRFEQADPRRQLAGPVTAWPGPGVRVGKRHRGKLGTPFRRRIGTRRRRAAGTPLRQRSVNPKLHSVARRVRWRATATAGRIRQSLRRWGTIRCRRRRRRRCVA